MLKLFVLAAVLSASVADEATDATQAPQLQDALDYLNSHQHLDNPYLRRDRRPDYIEHRDRVSHDLRGHDERRHDERRYDDRRNDERRHDDRRHDERRYDEHRDLLRGQKQSWWTDKDYIKHVDDEHDIPGPVILRNIKSNDDHRHLNIQRQNQIVEEVYSPDYAEPTWVVDYRYLKTGGRDYTRGPGGQIIILPKGIRTNEPKEFKDYDEMIEHLRQIQLKERSKPSYFMPLGQEAQPDYKSRGQHRDNRRWGY